MQTIPSTLASHVSAASNIAALTCQVALEIGLTDVQPIGYHMQNSVVAHLLLRIAVLAYDEGIGVNVMRDDRTVRQTL